MALSLSKKLGFSALAGLLALGALELGLRAFTREVGYASIPDETVRAHVEQEAMKYDPLLGWTRAELPMPKLGINAEGFRYGDVEQQKPAGTWRAFTLGDSQTYGAGVAAHQSYTAFAEQDLRQRLSDGRQLELINTGISGYTSLQALRLIRSKLLDWQPDLLVVDCRTHDSARDDVLDPTMNAGRLRQLLFHSRTYYLLHFAIERLRPRHARPMRGGSLDTPAAELQANFGNHELILELTRREGIDLLFVDYPFWETAPQGSQKEDKVICLAPRRELPEGVPVAPICEALQRSGKRPSELFLDNNHLSVLGNQIAGQALAEAIRQQGLLH